MQAPQLYDAISVVESVNNKTVFVPVQQCDRLALYCVATDATPGAKSFVAANVAPAADTITITAHGFVTGLKAALSGTNLPGGLSATNYWIVVVDANTIKLATSYANAVAGTVVDITSAGTTADAALTPTSLGSSTVDAKVSFDGVNAIAFASAKTITISGTGKQYLDLGSVNYPYIAIVFTAPTAGALTLDAYVYSAKTQVES